MLACIYFYLLYSKFNMRNRSYMADIKMAGCQLRFTETEHDSILVFRFKKEGSICKASSFLVHNNCFDVVSFVISKDIDTLYIRSKITIHEILKKECTFTPQVDITYNPVIDDLPSDCKVIPFSDSRFFVYNNEKCTYIPKDSTIHILHLIHDMERTNIYRLYDITLKDTLEICLVEK